MLVCCLRFYQTLNLYILGKLNDGLIRYNVNFVTVNDIFLLIRLSIFFTNFPSLSLLRCGPDNKKNKRKKKTIKIKEEEYQFFFNSCFLFIFLFRGQGNVKSMHTLTKNDMYKQGVFSRFFIDSKKIFGVQFSISILLQISSGQNI